MDTKSKTHEANPQKGFVVQINASENFGLVGVGSGTVQRVKREIAAAMVEVGVA
ncbi:MAG TPA: hypothetical protein VJ251_11880 [Stellaceae bacterium]|nr:hypothetical protein [Stellaceae bacterium]